MLDTVDEILAIRPLLEGRYFLDLKDRRLKREDFLRSQRQFFFAVTFFSRPMAALMARIPGSRDRQTLMHNLAEEHGFDEHQGDFRPSLAHDHTFTAFLRSIGGGDQPLSQAREGPAVRAFNLALLGACTMEPPHLAFGCLGLIEYAFADISAFIGQQVVERGWVRQEDLVHYALHAEIDKEHAQGFFQMVIPAWNAGGQSQSEVEQGLMLGHHLFHRLYEDLAELHSSFAAHDHADKTASGAVSLAGVAQG